MLANGDLGWLIGTFLTGAVPMLAGAVGMRRTLREGPGRICIVPAPSSR
jgi:hypothetical protein